MDVKIRTSWGEATIDLKKVKSFYCHVDIWENEYSIGITYKNEHSNQDDNLTAICDGFDAMMRLAKKLHDDLTINYM